MYVIWVLILQCVVHKRHERQKYITVNLQNYQWKLFCNIQSSYPILNTLTRFCTFLFTATRRTHGYQLGIPSAEVGHKLLAREHWEWRLFCVHCWKPQILILWWEENVELRELCAKITANWDEVFRICREDASNRGAGWKRAVSPVIYWLEYVHNLWGK